MGRFNYVQNGHACEVSLSLKNPLVMKYVVSLLKHMKSPSLICACRTERTRDQLMLELARGTNLLFWLGIAATTVSAGVLGYAIAKYVQISPTSNVILVHFLQISGLEIS